MQAQAQDQRRVPCTHLVHNQSRLAVHKLPDLEAQPKGFQPFWLQTHVQQVSTYCLSGCYTWTSSVVGWDFGQRRGSHPHLSEVWVLHTTSPQCTWQAVWEERPPSALKRIRQGRHPAHPHILLNKLIKVRATTMQGSLQPHDLQRPASAGMGTPIRTSQTLLSQLEPLQLREVEKREEELLEFQHDFFGLSM